MRRRPPRRSPPSAEHQRLLFQQVVERVPPRSGMGDALAGVRDARPGHRAGAPNPWPAPEPAPRRRAPRRRRARRAPTSRRRRARRARTARRWRAPQAGPLVAGFRPASPGVMGARQARAVVDVVGRGLSPPGPGRHSPGTSAVLLPAVGRAAGTGHQPGEADAVSSAGSGLSRTLARGCARGRRRCRAPRDNLVDQVVDRGLGLQRVEVPASRAVPRPPGAGFPRRCGRRDRSETRPSHLLLDHADVAHRGAGRASGTRLFTLRLAIPRSARITATMASAPPTITADQAAGMPALVSAATSAAASTPRGHTKTTAARVGASAITTCVVFSFISARSSSIPCAPAR